MLTCAELFIQLLDSKEFNYSSDIGDNGKVIVNFPHKNHVTKCIFSGEDGNYLALFLVYENIPDDKTADMLVLCNEINSQYKWVTFYLDKDNDLIINNNAILCPENAAEETFELLLRMIQITEELKPKIMRTIYA